LWLEPSQLPGQVTLDKETRHPLPSPPPSLPKPQPPRHGPCLSLSFFLSAFTLLPLPVLPSTPSRKTCFHLYSYFTDEYSYLFACPTYINKRGCVKRVSPCCDSHYKSVLLPFSLSSCQPRLESTSSMCLRPPPVVFQRGSSVIRSILPLRTASWVVVANTYVSTGKEMGLLRRLFDTVRATRHVALSALFGFLNSTPWSPSLVFFLFFFPVM